MIDKVSFLSIQDRFVIVLWINFEVTAQFPDMWMNMRMHLYRFKALNFFLSLVDLYLELSNR